jgi:hypothetical protein
VWAIACECSSHWNCDCVSTQAVLPSSPICNNTVFSLVPEPARKLRPNPSTVPLHRILQLAVFVSFSFTRTSTRQLNVEIQGTMPAILTLHFCSTWNQSGYCAPLLATMRLYRILQLAVFDCCPIARTSIRPADAGIQDILPSTTTLTFCSTRNQLGNFIPILATVRLHCTHQLAVFVLCPFTRTFIRLIDAGIQEIIPSMIALVARSTQNERGNCSPICLVLFAPLFLGSIRNCTSQICIFF